MSQPTNKLLDEFAKLMTDVADTAQGFKREADNVIRSRLEGFANELDLVTREEFNAVRTMAQKAREENDALLKRIEALEMEIGGKGDETGSSTT